MSNIFSLAEAVDLGIEKERKRKEFYDLVSKQFEDNSDMKGLFIKLRDWEGEHIQRFTEIRDSVDSTESAESYSGELQEYMKVFIEGKLYNQVSPEMFKEKKVTAVDAINIGLGFEKDAILFFSELTPYLGSENKEVINNLIDEEKKHILYLTQLKSKIQESE